jgi:hypothetical protein
MGVACTVNVVLPLTVAPFKTNDAVIVELPPETADATPEALMLAALVLDEVHETWVVIVCVLLSLYVPVATNGCALPA